MDTTNQIWSADGPDQAAILEEMEKHLDGTETSVWILGQEHAVHNGKILKAPKDTFQDLGMVAEWEKRTYTNGAYYVTHSGLVSPLPDQLEAIEEIRQEYLEDVKLGANNGRRN